MAIVPVIPVLLVAVIAKCKCEPTSGYNQNNGNGVSTFGELLKPPPPPPPISQIVPVPFHRGAGRAPPHNVDVGYNYQTPPPLPHPPVPPTSDLNFPAPFYKQYNFNFVPPPQPFTTTPSPSLFQKFSGWLFPSQQTQYQSGSPELTNNIAPLKKDCNPCNLVPWIPVIRYNLGAKSVHQNSIPTYGPPSPTAYADVQNLVKYRPQPFQFHNQEQKSHQISGIPHAIYGPPTQTHSGSVGILSSTVGPPSPTYGPPSPTYLPPSPTHIQPSPTYGAPSSTYVIPIPTPNPPSSTYSEASSSYAIQSSTNLGSSSIGFSDSSYNSLSTSYGLPSSSYGAPSSTYKPPATTYATPSFERNVPVTPNYETGLNKPPKSDVEILNAIQPVGDFQLPKVTHPTGFRNSYGEPIINTYALDIPYPVSATAAESIKIKTEVLPHENMKPSTPNISITLANPAPFTLNRGRNIHTLQPVALPNLSVSPLPPIFNARPFRPVTKFPTQFVQGVNSMQQASNNVNIAPSIPVAEFTHSVDYPPSIIQSPIIDVEISKNTNQTKAYRNILNGYVVDEIRDISSQASEDHVSATNSNRDSSFESTGAEVGNDIYNGMPTDLKYNSNFQLNQNSFADLRGVKDEDVDKYRTESNLQSIDSPLLYLKPSAPHKDHKKFVLALSTSINNEYEIYDDISTTAEPQLSTIRDLWDNTRTDYNDYSGLSSPPIADEDANQPKVVQIIIPYTTGNHKMQNSKDFQPVSQDWAPTPIDDYQARKAPSNTEKNYNINTVTEGFTTISTSTEEPTQTVTEHYELETLNTPAILNDLYDVKEPPFDIIKLQHNIDDWTEQEYSKRYKIPERVREKEKYAQAKQIPDDYFTTVAPITNYVTLNTNNYELYDHEGSSSIQHTVTDEKKNNTLKKPRKEYNTIERTKNKYLTAKNDESEIQKLHIYTAASSFRSSTTTPAPWGQIQTSISPLTKEKVYVVTSKPWRGSYNTTNNWYEVESFESKKTNIDNTASASDNLQFKSPRFSNRPSFGFTAGGKIESLKSDSSYVFSKSWHQRINDLEPLALNDGTSLSEGSDETVTTNTDKDITAPVTAEPHTKS